MMNPNPRTSQKRSTPSVRSGQNCSTPKVAMTRTIPVSNSNSPVSLGAIRVGRRRGSRRDPPASGLQRNLLSVTPNSQRDKPNRPTHQRRNHSGYEDRTDDGDLQQGFRQV